MRKVLLIALQIVLYFGAFAQFPGNGNDWVKYDRTYYKFGVSEDGIYRLNKADLLAAGFQASDIVGSKFQMFHNADEVPLYVSTSSTFGDNDFIEFYGEKNTGEADSYLYENEFQHPTPSKSFFSDQSVYFLTLNTGTNLRLNTIANDLTNLPAKEEYFMEEFISAGDEFFTGKYTIIAGTGIKESYYDDAEGYNFDLLHTRSEISYTNTEHAYLGADAPRPIIKTKVFPQKNTSGTEELKVQLRLKDSDYKDVFIPGTRNYHEVSMDFDPSYLGNSSTAIRIKNLTNYRIRVGELKLLYAHKLTFTDLPTKRINFNKSGSLYLEMQDLPGSQVILYDLSSNQRIVESVSSITKIKTSSSSSKNDLAYGTDISKPDFIETTDFDNYLSGNYDILAIYHPALEAEIDGENYIDKWVNHKKSDSGGSWTVKKVNILQLYDQFSFGIPFHSGAIKNFVEELSANNNLPNYVVLLGKGYEYHRVKNNYSDFFIPTYGDPGSDSQLVSHYYQSKPLCAVGRIAARSTTDLKNYVDKVIEYETDLNDHSDAVQTKEKLWMKNALHLGGGVTSGEQNLFKSYLNRFKAQYEDPKVGGKASQFFKTSTDPIQTIDSEEIDSLMNTGLGLINYFGHSSPGALEFNLNDPSQYDNQGKYPFMLTNGCYVGDIFQSNEALSETFVLEQNGGTLTFMGPSQFGIAQGMNAVCTKFYDSFVEDDYGTTIGDAVFKSVTAQSVSNFIARTTVQQLIFHGDPTLRMYAQPAPDYLIEPDDVLFEPNIITSDVEEFTVKVVVSNIGKAIDEEVPVRLIRTLPNGEQIIFDKTFDHVYYQDTLSFNLVTNSLLNEGQNTFVVQIDPDNTLNEITRFNNNIKNPIIRSISSNNIEPIFVSDFGITDNPTPTLIASSQQFYLEKKPFIFQIDTTELFNSSLLYSETIESNGGTINWDSQIEMVNERVYYWRVKLDVEDSEWTNSSFVYLTDYSEGWNQSHYYQYKYDGFSNIQLNESQNFVFGEQLAYIDVKTGMPGYIPNINVSYSLQDIVMDKKSCPGNTFAVAIFDPVTGLPVQNSNQGGGYGLYHSRYCSPYNEKAFYYKTNTAQYRKDFMDMLDEVPNGHYVLIYSHGPANPTQDGWNDDAITIFDKLTEQGALQANNIGDETPYVFFFQKGNTGFEYQKEVLATDPSTIITERLQFSINASEGKITSTEIGPVKSWDKFEWAWNSSLDDNPDGDEISYSIYGIRANGQTQLLHGNKTDAELDLSSIDASVFRQLRIVVNFKDIENFTPPQLEYMRVIYEELPELYINVQSIIDQYPLTYKQGEQVDFTYTLTNVSSSDFEPVLVNYQITDGNGNQTSEDLRTPAIKSGESIELTLSKDLTPAKYIGNNILYIDANAFGDQREQFHFNNVALINFNVNQESENPYLDVTFDGVHIIDGDLVTDQPHIVITLTDENEFLALDNPDAIRIYVTEPGQTDETIYTVSSPEVTFYPADLSDPNSKNVATIEFTPSFAIGTHQLRVQAQDRIPNQSGLNDYLVNFEVTNEDIITQVINYPNPFTTQTQFIAQIIGDAPDQVMIQIFSPSGKLVRELESDAASISISQGNNFYTIATWDGTDTYGDAVGNGVYFYKISMKRNGETVEMYNTENHSEYFHNGIGKLYIMR